MGIDRSAAAQHACALATAAATAGDSATALRHYEYAQRLAPGDAEITLAIGAMRLNQHDPRAAEAFAIVAECDDVSEARLGLAAAHHQTGFVGRAAQELRALLARHGYVRGTNNAALHDAIALADRAAGWCGLSADGRLRVTLFDPAAGMDRVVVLFDGAPPGSRPRRRRNDGEFQRAVFTLPEAWRHAGLIAVCLQGRHLLGSPIEAGTIGRVEGFVQAQAGGLLGWAWFPRDPDCIPMLTVRDAAGRGFRVTAADPAPGVAHCRPLARPRLIDVPADRLRGLAVPLMVLDANGRHLYGSPLDPLADMRSAAGAAELTRRLFPASSRGTGQRIDLPLPAVPADIVGAPPSTRRIARAAGVDVVIPVYRGHAQTMACLDSVLASLPTGARCIVIDDASPDAPLVAALRALAERGRIVLRRQTENRGFPATANAGIRTAAAGRDVILLNSDTLVPPGWIERLADAAYSAPDIGSATPFSNDATIFSYPREDCANPFPDATRTVALDRLARRANAGRVVDVPTAHGFCVYLRRDCLTTVGLLREDLFAQGYGEENDFCIRARHLGWRHVAVPGVFVAHAGGASFGDARSQLLARNLAIINRLHPGYDALIAQFRRADALAESRFRIDTLRWRAARGRKGAVVLVTHARAGGVRRHVAERCAAIAQTGMRPIVVTPATDAQGRRRCRLDDMSGETFPNLRFDTAAGLTELVAFLRADQPTRVELHHFVGHDPALLGLAHALDVPYDVIVHDYAWICPRITLVGPEKRYCGEPDAVACDACYSDLGGAIEEDIRPSRLRLRSHSVLAGARHVVAPSQDAARRLARHFPDIRVIVRPWENDAALPAPRARQSIGRLRLRVAVLGAIGIDKGYEYLLACARHAAARRLPLEFVVIGHTCDDKRLLDTGAVLITGPYEEAEADGLIRAQQADIGFLPALWPETWSYTLSQMWQAGLDVVAFDIGAPAERLRRTGRGRLLPLGLPPTTACQALLAYRRGGEASRLAAAAEPQPVAAE